MNKQHKRPSKFISAIVQTQNVPLISLKLNLIIFLVILLTGSLISPYANAQIPTFQWAKGFVGTNLCRVLASKVDADGNIVTTGYFDGTVDFDPGAGVFNLTAVAGVDIFISKLDAAGNFVWAKSLGGSGGDLGRSITLDATGNIYISGSFLSVVDFDPGPAIFNLTSLGNSDVFILKLNASGSMIWARRIGSSADDVSTSLAMDPSGNVYAAGTFFGTVDFDPGTGIFNLSSSGGSQDFFISKFDSLGSFVWAKRMGGTGNDHTISMAIDALGNIHLAGVFFNTVDFDPGSGVFNLTSVSNGDIFISKLDLTGSFMWAKRIGAGTPGSIDDIARSIAVDGGGNIYVGGDFGSTVDFDPGPGVFNLTSANDNSYILKLNASGDFTWAKLLNSVNQNYLYSLTTDFSGNVYASGVFSGVADFDPGSGSFNLTATSVSLIFIWKLNSSGIFEWAKSIGSTGTNIGISILTDIAGNVYTSGIFASTTDFDPDAGVFNVTGNGGFVQKMSQCISSSPPLGAATISPSSICLGQSVTINYVPPACQTSLDFKNKYGPLYWVTAQIPANSNGTINTALAPASISLVSSNAAVGGGPGTTAYSALIQCAGTLTFNWSYNSVDGAAYDYPQYSIDGGTPVLFTGYSLTGTNAQSGTVSVNVNAGQLFSLQVYSVDNSFGSCTVVISNFSAPDSALFQHLDVFETASGGIPLNFSSVNTIALTPANIGYKTYYAAASNNTCYSANRIPLSVIVSTPLAGTATATATSNCVSSNVSLLYNAPSCQTAFGFQQTYQPSNWTLTQQPLISGGTVNTSLAPISISMTSSDGISVGNSASTNYSITMPCSGTLSFNWRYSTQDGPLYDYPQYSINGAAPVLFTGFNLLGSNIQSGTVSISVLAGQTVSLNAYSADNLGGPCTTIISNFSAPSIPIQSVTWYDALSGGTILGYGNATTYTPTSSGNFTYYAEVKDNLSSCINPVRVATNSITINASPTVNVSASANPICAENSSVLTATGAISYAWQPGSMIGASVNVSPLTTTTYTVTGTNSNGCTNTSTITITVNPLPNVLVSSSNSNICSGNSTTLTALNASSYTWNPGALSGSVITVSPTTTTTYTVTGTGINGCTKTATKSIQVNPLPNVDATISSGTICAGTSITLTGLNASTYSWNPGALSGSVITVSPTTSTTYTVTGTGANGCTKTITKSVTVNSVPNVTISASASTICLGNSASLTGSNAISYTWNPGPYSGTTIFVSPASATTYTVTGTAANGCTNTATKTITVTSCGSTLNLKCFIQGYYTGAGLMNHVLQNESVAGATSVQADTIIVQLRNITTPYGIASSVKTILNTNGTAICNFPVTGNYYLAIKHRNGLETWSSYPITMLPTTTYDFTTDPYKVFGNNQVEVEAGVWAFYSGDINQDENIDLLDATFLETDINEFQFGYFATDLNGDGNVDLLDSPVLEANINAFVFSMHP